MSLMRCPGNGKAPALCLLMGACRVINYGSNLPDGGVCPAIDGGGSGALTGAEAFQVTSATESLLAYQSAYYDAGRTAGWYDAGSQFVQITLLGPEAPCPNDAGGCVDQIVADLSNASDAGWDGIYLLGDGGSAFLGGEIAEPNGVRWLSYLATSGQIQVSSTLACSISGSFSAWLAMLVPDAGVDAGYYLSDGGPLSGTFNAVYSDAP